MAVVQQGALPAVNINQSPATSAPGNRCQPVAAKELRMGFCKTSSKGTEKVSKQVFADILCSS